MIKDFIEKYFTGNHTFVEIGAYDGETYSHTTHLADAGWKGYYFEPVVEYAMQCMNRHRENKVETIPVAIGNPGIHRFYVSDLLSTFQGQQYQDKVLEMEYFKNQGKQFRKRMVAVMHPRYLPECDLLVIDVEGSEYFILEHMKIKPSMIVVELHERSEEWQNTLDTTKSGRLLEEIGYKKVYADDIDSVFIYE